MRTERPARYATALLLAVATTVGPAACGGDGPTEPDPGPDVTIRLQMEDIGTRVAGVPFDVTVSLMNDEGAPVQAEAPSTITLSVDAGMGALRGTTSATLAAGTTGVTITDVIYDHAEDGVRLMAAGAGGTAGGLSATSEAMTVDFDFSRQLVAFRRSMDDRQDIYLMTSDGLAFVNLTDDPAVDSDPAWSPDGSRIAFVSTRAGNADLWVVNVDGTGLTQVTDNHGSVRFPNWSPDGSVIAYSANVDDQRDIYVIDAPAGSSSAFPSSAAQTGPPTQITDDPGADNEPVWSPSGDELFFYSNRDGQGAVWTFEIDGPPGSEPVRLTVTFDFACAPGMGWSITDGRSRLAFVGETEDQLDIWTMDLDGSNQVKVTDHPADEFYSSWTSEAPGPAATTNGAADVPTSASANQEESARLIFDSNRDGRWQLYSIGEDGGDEIRLTDHASDDRMPRWRPPVS